jgi:hypothetical protein
MSSLRCLAVSALCVVASAGCAVPAQDSSTSPDEEIVRDENGLIIVPIGSCKTVKANTTVSMYGGSTGVTRYSLGNAYGSLYCDRYVLDVYVYGSATVPAGYNRKILSEGHGTVVDDEAWTLPYPAFSAECADYREDVTVYSGVLDPSTKLGGGTRRGVTRMGYLGPTGQWTPPRCVLVEQDGFMPIGYGTTPQPDEFAVTYRVAIKAYKASTGEKLPVVASVLRDAI